MLKIQDKDFSDYLTDIKVKLVRTYKGEVKRTQTGKVAAFPTSFITVGIDLAFLGDRFVMEEIQRLALSANVVDLVFTYNGIDLRGMFSLTTSQDEEVRDKGERSKTLALSLVSDGSDITKADGTKFTIYTKQGSSSVEKKTGCAFARVYLVAGVGSYYLNGAKVPLADNSTTTASILVLGDVYLTSTAQG